MSWVARSCSRSPDRSRSARLTLESISIFEPMPAVAGATTSRRRRDAVVSAQQGNKGRDLDRWRQRSLGRQHCRGVRSRAEPSLSDRHQHCLESAGDTSRRARRPPCQRLRRCRSGRAPGRRQSAPPSREMPAVPQAAHLGRQKVVAVRIQGDSDAPLSTSPERGSRPGTGAAVGKCDGSVRGWTGEAVR